jgi:hypothetical protein
MPQDGDDDSDSLGESHLALWEAHLTKVDEHRIRMVTEDGMLYFEKHQDPLRRGEEMSYGPFRQP